MGGLPKDITEPELKLYFEGFGPVADCVVMKNEDTNIGRGFAYLTYKSIESTEELFVQGRFHQIKGRKIECLYAFPKQDDDPKISKKKKKQMEEAVTKVQSKACS